MSSAAPRTASASARRCGSRGCACRSRRSSRRPTSCPRRSRSRSSCGRPSRSAATAAAPPARRPSCGRCSRRRCTRARSARCGTSEEVVRARRRAWGVRLAYRRVDSCAGEVEAGSNYFYSTYGEADEGAPTGERLRVVILGSGPNRIGQGIEFDYCCVHAAQAFRALGYEAVMVNCNPETVSTDYDTSDRLYFEPLGVEEVLAICERERPDGVVIQFGGQTPLKLGRGPGGAGFRLVGTAFDAVDVAEDRERFGALLDRLGIRCPEWGIASSTDEAAVVAERIGFPVLIR